MELHEKLQQLRKQSGLTQEELAEKLYVSRTAISKWESGRGYPSIDSLKALSKFFSVSIDTLLSGDELLDVVQENQKQSKNSFLNMIFGLMDISAAMLLFFPFFAEKEDLLIRGVSLLSLTQISPYLKIFYFVFVIGMIVSGILMIALQNCRNSLWIKSKNKISFALGIASILLFILGSHPYAAIFTLALSGIKVSVLFKKL
jgi:transcriptional regulator with XRE-family HTH domain